MTFLFYPRTVCDHPKLNTLPERLSEPVEASSSWLEADTRIEGVWLPSIGAELDLAIKGITWQRRAAPAANCSMN